MKDKARKGRERDGDEKKETPPVQRNGNTAPDDPALVEWLERLWTRDNPPERIEVWRVVGSNRDVRRAMVYYENFKPDERPDIEQCTKLAGEIMAAAQNDCDCAEKRSLYEVAVLDPFQKAAQPLLRRIGPLSPVRQYAIVGPDGDLKPLEDDEDELGLKPLAHRYLSKMFKALDRTLQQIHLAAGDVMQLQQGIIVNQQNHVQNLQQANMGLYGQMQDAQDRSLDREVAREREKMKTKAIGTGLGVGKNLLISWFGPPAGDDESESSDGSKKAASKPRATSTEQRLVESFLEECKEDESLLVELFGDWKVDKGELTLADIFVGRGLVRPGIFTPHQFGILISVRDGSASPDALDSILPNSGQEHEITLEQMLKAQPLLSQSMFIALQQIRDLRERKRERIREKPPTPPETESQ